MEIDEEMTMGEIEDRFDSEWVLINDPVTDKQLHLLGGRVRFHTPDRAELYKNANRLATNRAAIRFIGRPPEDMQFLL